MTRQILIGLMVLLFLLNCPPNVGAQTDEKKSVRVNIFLLDDFESENLSENLRLFAVEREVGAASPLRSAIEAQLAGATDEENSQALHSPVIGIKLISVRVKNKTAYAGFKRTRTEALNRIDALRFVNAVTETARQFPSIRRIEICLDGNLNFGGTSKTAPARLKTVKIYLPKYDGSDNSGDLQPVERMVDKDAPLRPTLELLFAPQLTADEDRQRFGTATFGMKFQGVELKNGTAIVRFSQPPNETDYGSTGIFTFDSAVEKTVRQFAAVKRVKICAVGATQIDSELVEPYPRCPKTK